MCPPPAGGLALQQCYCIHCGGVVFLCGDADIVTIFSSCPPAPTHTHTLPQCYFIHCGGVCDGNLATIFQHLRTLLLSRL